MWSSPVIRRLPVPVPGLAAPLRVVQLSDLHFGLVTPVAVLARAVALALAEEPDCVVLTGDFVSRGRRHLGVLTETLRPLGGRALAVLGNHDHFVGGALVTRALSAAGIEVLANRWTRVGALAVVGLDDRLTGHADAGLATRGLAADTPAIGLAHDPGAAPALWSRGVRVVLSGHTHGGQVHLPPITTGLHAVFGQVHLSGWNETPAGSVYVNAGLGSGALPLRIGAPARREVAVLHLRDVGRAG
jgi:predicted MPP superfamily phosphohydrolase